MVDMSELFVLTAAQQVAAHLRKELVRGMWTGLMPGSDRLAAELGVGRDTAEAALRELEREGWLINQGRRRGRRIMLPKNHAPPGLRVGILFYEKGTETDDLFIRFQNRLNAAGHTVVHAPKNLTDIRGNTRRLARMIKETHADAWVVIAGSVGVLKYFEQRQVPVFALFGFMDQLGIAGIGLNLVPSVVAATRRLVALGHRRIVVLSKTTTLSHPGIIGAAFLAEMAAHGIEVGPYNVPGWEGGYDGFYRCLESLFSHTPPTAIFIFSAAEYFATAQFLLHRGLRVPQDVSLVCCYMAQYFKRYQPSISHVHWNDQLVVNRIARWVKNVSQGKEDTRQSWIKVELIEGGTIGPVV